MGAVTVGLLILGSAGLALLAAALIFGEALSLHGADADGPFSVTAMSAFLGAFGFVGAIGSELAGGAPPAAIVAGTVAGTVGAVPAAWLAVRLTRSLSNMNTDATLTAANLIGATGVVVTPVPAIGYGEVRVMAGGQLIKLNAKSDGPLPVGTAVFVVEAPSESSVVVLETTALP
jgi:membrane protein implicated in regulation of membrane protease activity